VTEAPSASPKYSPMSAFLQGYGLAEEEWLNYRAWYADASSGWPRHVLCMGRIGRSWLSGRYSRLLQSIKNICNTPPY